MNSEIIDKIIIKFTSILDSILMSSKRKTIECIDENELFYLSIAHVEILQEIVINIYEKSNDPIAKGYISKSNLEFILEYVKEIPEESKQRKTKLINQAAFIFYHIAVKHPFADGNKRTAIITCNAFLENNGYSIRHISFRESRKFIIEVAMGNKSEIECQKFIKKHISKFTVPKEVKEMIKIMKK